MEKEKVHGFMVNFDEPLRHTGLYYLRQDLQFEEARSLFEAARNRGQSHFEDDHERQFTLTYNRGDGTYNLERR